MTRADEKETLFAFFDVLCSYVGHGYLEVQPETGEAYITMAAMTMLSRTYDETKQIEEIKKSIPEGKKDARIDVLSERMAEKMRHVASAIREYALWLGANAEGYKIYKQMLEQAKDQPYSDLAGEQASENAKRIHAAADRIAARLQNEAFAIHVVEDHYPHQLCYTIFLDMRRSLVQPWKKREHMEIINYRK